MQYDINEEPIVISKSILDLFLEQENSGDLIALYTFYYYTAKWQKTNQVKATVEYVANGLKWSSAKVRLARSVLKDLQLIEDVQVRSNGKMGERYVKINFIWSNHRTHDFCSTTKSYYDKSQANALSADRENALSADKKNSLSQSSLATTTSKDIRYVSFAEKLDETCQSFGKKKQTNKTLHQWARHFRLLHTADKVSVQDINKTLEWYSKNIGKDFVPEAFCGKSFRDKFDKLQNAINRNTRSTSSRRQVKILHHTDKPDLSKCDIYYNTDTGETIETKRGM